MAHTAHTVWRAPMSNSLSSVSLKTSSVVAETRPLLYWRPRTSSVGFLGLFKKLLFFHICVRAMLQTASTYFTVSWHASCSLFASWRACPINLVILRIAGSFAVLSEGSWKWKKNIYWQLSSVLASTLYIHVLPWPALTLIPYRRKKWN